MTINIKPLIAKEYDEKKYTCWDLCRDIYALNNLGKLPAFSNIDKHGALRGARGIQESLSQFKACDYEEGALALMKVANTPLHIGVCVGNGGICHLDYKRGVVIEFKQDLDIAGYYRHEKKNNVLR